MRVLRLEAERRRQDISKSELARRSRMATATVIEACNGKRTPGEIQLVKLAQGLEWPGEPAELLEEVDE